MLVITTFPRRFPTANKRPLRLPAQVARILSSCATRDSSSSAAAVAASVKPRSFSAPSSSLLAAPLRAFSSPSGTRAVHSKVPAGQSSSFATSAARVHDEEDHHHDVYDDSFLFGERADDWFTTARNPRTDPTFPGVDRATGRLNAIKMPDLRSCSRQEMLDYLDNAWATK
ncbi:hypothetical protein PF005_g22852 [Phytophthora fragariae]|uniref:Uncharacterized protein n=1 Tax=Phytophthora fragariae TaxID=53985 RepID=A0A6A3RUQ1_9STRA|nr:hypothetical protein PF003_g2794 [Phytophthora fragariae]KAE8926165.1 hypothetical protein PF009_g23643 [Phytophthora fragariae]KAE8982468.1 hypothetical protein PF011_g21604 [Phytophthora fragariae]KAE9080288.1 hypothetical protein PF010_g22435 [Phytophthora fragariae]KAE9080847.1 hypothetical protein PF007_g22878 [Phytophthora fragariae]